MSLAWGITEHLHDRVGCRTLFSTHYHELEAHHLQQETRPRLIQSSLFAGTDDPVLAELRELDVDAMSAEGLAECARRWHRDLRG